MDFERLYEIILKIYKECNVTEFPIDCFAVVRGCGYQIQKYSDLTDKKRAACIRLSTDSCIVGDTLYYEDRNIPERTRFSMMHELGHVFLGSPSEELADTFSSHILAPRIAIHKSGCKTADQLHSTFGLSYAASNRALADYRTWFDRICRTTRKPLPAEQRLESILFPAQPPQDTQLEDRGARRSSKRRREMDERAAYFQELRCIYGEDRVFHMLEDQWNRTGWRQREA